MKRPSVEEVWWRIVKGSGFSFLALLLTRGAGFLQSIVIARGLDPSRVGMFSMVSYVLSVAGACADLGLPAAAAKLIAEVEPERGRALKGLLFTLSVVMLTMAGLAGLLLFVASGPLASLYREPELKRLFRVGSGLLALSLLGGFLGGVLQGVQRITALAVVGVAKALTSLGVTLLLLPAFGLVGILFASIVAEVVGGLVAKRPLQQALAPRVGHGTLVFSWPLLRRALALGLPILLNGLLLWGTPWLVRSYLASTRGYRAVGFFQVADTFSRLPLLIPTAVAVPFMPAVSAAEAVVPAEVAPLAGMTLRSTVLVTLPVALVLFVLARPLVGAVYGSPYVEAGALAELLVLAAFFQAMNVLLWSLLVATGRVRVGLLLQLFAHAVLLTLTLTLVPWVGLPGVGIAHLVAASGQALGSLAYVRISLGVTGAAGPGR